MKENTIKIMERATEIGTEKTRIKIYLMTETSYFLGVNNNKIKELNTIINKNAVDSLITFNLFVKECVANFFESRTQNIITFLEENLEQLQKNFIQEYFI